MSRVPAQRSRAVDTPGSPAENNSIRERTRLVRLPAAFASRFDPYGRRQCYWITYRCPYCSGAGHLGRSRDRIATGVRRTACGRMVWLVVARVYTAAPEWLEAVS